MVNKFEHTTGNIYVTKTGRIETCRRKEKGLPCSRHEPLRNTHQLLLHSRNRVLQKLTPFERKMMKFLSLISNTKEQQLREEYSKIVAQHYLNGVRTPNSEEIKGLQKLLLEVAAMSPEVEENKAKKWFKKATLGESFTTAGFWGARDLLKRTLGRVKNFFAGGILASTLFVTSCAPGAPTQTTQQEHTLEEYENLAEEETFIFDEEFMAKLIKDPSEKYMQYVVGDDATNLKLQYDYHGYEIMTDEFGSYKIVKMSVPEPYIEAFPLPSTSKYTDDEMRDALRFFTDYALNDLVDSPALDNAEAWWGWWEERGQHFVISDETSYEMFGYSLREDISGNKLKVTDTIPVDRNWAPMVRYTGFINNIEGGTENIDWRHNLLIRDGESRVANKQVHDITVKVESDGLFVHGVVGVGAIYDFVRKMKARQGDEFNEVLAGLEDNTISETTWDSIGFGAYLVLEQDGWKIAGYFVDNTIGPAPFERVTFETPYGYTYTTTEQRPDLRYVGLFSQ